MAKILVIGASSGIGLEASRQALRQGHEVVGFSRHANESPLSDPRLKLMSGDARSPEDVRQALEGTDAVIQALGVKLRPRTMLMPVTLFSRATRVLVAAMEQTGVKRLLAVTGFGAGESRAAIPAPLRLPFDLVLGRAYDDKGFQERLIENSSLDWTIVRPGILTDGPRTGHYRVVVDPENWRPGCISRADVADFLVASLASATYQRKAVALVS